MSFDAWLGNMIGIAAGVGQEKRRLFYRNEEDKMASSEKMNSDTNASGEMRALIGAQSQQYSADRGLDASKISDSGQTYRLSQQLGFDRDKQAENAGLLRTQLANQNTYQMGSLTNSAEQTRLMAATGLSQQNLVTTDIDGVKTTSRGSNPNFLTPSASQDKSTAGMIDQIASPPSGVDISGVRPFFKQDASAMKPVDLDKLSSQFKLFGKEERRAVWDEMVKKNPALGQRLVEHQKEKTTPGFFQSLFTPSSGQPSGTSGW